MARYRLRLWAVFIVSVTFTSVILFALNNVDLPPPPLTLPPIVEVVVTPLEYHSPVPVYDKVEFRDSSDGLARSSEVKDSGRHPTVATSEYKSNSIGKTDTPAVKPADQKNLGTVTLNSTSVSLPKVNASNATNYTHECYTLLPEDEDVYDYEYWGPYNAHPDTPTYFRFQYPSSGEKTPENEQLQGDKVDDDGVSGGVPMVVHFFWETRKGLVPPKCIMLLPLLSLLHYMPQRPIVIHSNTLPLDFFSEIQKATIIVERYSLSDIAYAEGLPGASWLRNHLSEYEEPPPSQNYTAKPGTWAMHHISDFLRLAWLYIYGGSYLDFDFVITREFPMVTNVVARSEHNGCPGRYRMTCVPQRFQDCLPDKTALDAETFFMPHNGALFNFRPQNPYIRRCLEQFSTYWNKNCKGCAGPGLLTNVFTNFITDTGKPPPKLHTMPTSGLVVTYGAGAIRGRVPVKGGALIIHFLHGSSPSNVTLPLGNGTLLARWDSYLRAQLVKKGVLETTIPCGQIPKQTNVLD
ncbi:hypothetical protein Pelo_1507 [Pelomyxa schiedti]|nr:hypothetical protein Pelo_1507 [Pelomyxa schiedti]